MEEACWFLGVGLRNLASSIGPTVLAGDICLIGPEEIAYTGLVRLSIPCMYKGLVYTV